MHRPLILDGAMGTMIQSAGLKLGEKPEIFALKNPDAVMEIQKEYIKAGSDVLYSNTFGANR
ncbi:MAG: homocysteine S-methyltransferase family protein, partial [Spirochaetales bacterium]